MRRYRKLGILYTEQDSYCLLDAAAVMLVTPKLAVREEFTTFLNQLRATQQLNQIVINKYYIVLNRQYNFYKEMQRLGKLAATETQIVILTATLLLSKEDKLFQQIYVKQDQVNLFQAETTRLNIAYCVIRVEKVAKKKEVEEIVLGIVQQKLRKHKTGKVVVYSNLVLKVKKLAKKLGCHAYYYKAISKVSMLKKFTASKKQVVVATSALGIGVNILDIQCIIHINQLFTILDYAQKSSRAG